MPKVRKTTHKNDSMIKISRPSANELSRCKVGSGVSLYSGPEPQLLPFPPELVARILGYVDRACDKRNARLVCKGFAAAGLSSLTSTAHFSTSIVGIDYSSEAPQCSSPALEMAMHPVVSKYITTLVCNGTQLSTSYLTLRDFRKWWATLCMPRTLWPIDKIFNIYVSRYAQEDWISRTGEDQRIFCRALENFPKLDCVMITDIKMDGPRDWPRPTWPLAVPQGDLWDSSSPYHNFAMCIRSLSEMGIKLRELHILGRDNAISHAIFLRASPEDYTHILNVFANLRKVVVNFNTHQDTYPLTFAGLGRALTHATKLQFLDLKCHSGVVRRSRLLVSSVFREFTWPHLKHVCLSGFRLHTDVGLIAFFHRHRATIDSVTFKFMFLHQKDFGTRTYRPCEAWKHFFDELRKRSIKFQDLQLYRIHDCSNSEFDDTELHSRAGFGSRVLRYLCDGGPNPLDSVPTNNHIV